MQWKDMKVDVSQIYIKSVSRVKKQHGLLKNERLMINVPFWRVFSIWDDSNPNYGACDLIHDYGFSSNRIPSTSNKPDKDASLDRKQVNAYSSPMRGVYGVALDSVCLHSYLRKISLVAKLTYSNFLTGLKPSPSTWRHGGLSEDQRGPTIHAKSMPFSWFLFLKSLHGKDSLKTYHPLRSRLWSPMDFCTMRRLWAIWGMNWGNLSEEQLKFNFMVFGASCFFGESQVSYFRLKFQIFSSELSFSHTNGLVKRGVCPHHVHINSLQ